MSPFTQLFGAKRLYAHDHHLRCRENYITSSAAGDGLSAEPRDSTGHLRRRHYRRRHISPCRRRRAFHFSLALPVLSPRPLGVSPDDAALRVIKHKPAAHQQRRRRRDDAPSRFQDIEAAPAASIAELSPSPLFIKRLIFRPPRHRQMPGAPCHDGHARRRDI